MDGAFNLSDTVDGESIQSSQPAAAETGACADNLAPRPAAVEWIDPAALTSAQLAEWQALSAQSAEANVFAEPWMVMAGITHCHEGRDARLVFIRDQSHRLIGVAPLALRREFGRLPIRMIEVWSHPNSFLGMVMVADGRALEFWLRLLPALANGPLRAPIVCVDGLPADGAAYLALIEAGRQLTLPISQEGATTRAMLATQTDPETYWEESVRAKKRKELRRQWARLSEQGNLTTDQLSAAPAGTLAGWINEFLDLEKSGWKGANGSALASNADTEGFFRAAMTAANAAGQLEMTALRINGRAIAMLITLISGQAGFSFKTAFDEDYARFSPGVLLQRESLAILHLRRLAWIDSCAAQDHPMIDSLWRERRTVVSVALPLPGASHRMTFAAARVARDAWHRIKRLRQPLTRTPTPRPDHHGGPAPAGPAQEDDQ